ncbi:MAG: hypothetical protein DWB42_10005 [Chloroflexi bacterium]|nr:hypothetical protein [Chloroflexota bacterium]MDL1884376.1 hypothetical protein [Anaerolineae bacterium CFX8]
MNNRQPNRQFGEVLLGLLLLVIGLSALAEGAFPWLLLVAAGGYMLWRQYQASQRDDLSDELFEEVHSAGRQSGAETVYAHALKSVERAGLDPNEVRVLPVDIGVMAFRGDSDPTVYRTRPIPDDVDYVQPFVQLRLPTKATGRIKFEILDSDGQAIFIHEDFHQLERGRNLITPAARLPIHDAQAMHNAWQLRISADGLTLATHRFDWQESNLNRVRRHLAEDGEISNELRAALTENRLNRISLDDLLSYQDDAEQQQKG